MNRKIWRYAILFVAIMWAGFSSPAKAQTPATHASPEPVPETLPDFIQQAQTIHIPLTAIDRETTLPAKNLTESDLNLNIDGKPRPFQLSRLPHSDAPLNLLIVLPFGDLQSRKAAIEQAIAAFSADAFSKETAPGWNISILDDAGNQTHYTRDVKTVIAQLKELEREKSADISPDDWRITLTLSIAAMRDLPGRRIVMSLGDIFHAIFTDQNQEAYEAFAIQDVANAARNSGAVIYAAESYSEIALLRELAPSYSLIGSGPWLLQMRDGSVAGWITDSIAATLDQIRRDGAGSYNIDLHLDTKQLNGQLQVVSVQPKSAELILGAPSYYIAPDLATLRLLATVPLALRQALTAPSPDDSPSPLELATQLAYFPHPDGKTGTQIATTGFFWNAATEPPAQMATALQLEQTSSGYITNTTVGNLRWTATKPTWSDALTVTPGAYRLRVAAADASGKVHASLDTPFTIAPAINDPVLISSLVLGKSCVFIPQDVSESNTSPTTDYLRAGNCDLRPDATHFFSPADVIWTLVRVTPTGNLSSRPSKDWKANFAIVDSNGSRLAEDSVHWLPSDNGSFVATTAFPLNNPKRKLVNGEYAVVFRLKGPGLDEEYEEDTPFTVYDVPSGTVTH